MNSNTGNIKNYAKPVDTDQAAIMGFLCGGSGAAGKSANPKDNSNKNK